MVVVAAPLLVVVTVPGAVAAIGETLPRHR
jgi:hypothetical protein